MLKLLDHIVRKPIPDFHYRDQRREKTIGIVIHYTACPGDVLILAEWMARAERQASAHFYIGREGEENARIISSVPHRLVSYHCRGFNSSTISIELNNAGFLEKRGDEFFTWSGRRYQKETPVFKDDKWWEPFDDFQINDLCDLIIVLKEEYSGIKFLAGHCDLDPKRKVDPGSVFPWEVVETFTQLERYSG